MFLKVAQICASVYLRIWQCISQNKYLCVYSRKGEKQTVCRGMMCFNNDKKVKLFLHVWFPETLQLRWSRCFCKFRIDQHRKFNTNPLFFCCNALFSPHGVEGFPGFCQKCRLTLAALSWYWLVLGIVYSPVLCTQKSETLN